jgi:hypothetical protein
MMPKFDPKRPHGTTYGHPEIAHVQDGVDYGFDDLPVGTEGPDPDRSAKMKEVWAKRKAGDSIA